MINPRSSIRIRIEKAVPWSDIRFESKSQRNLAFDKWVLKILTDFEAMKLFNKIGNRKPYIWLKAFPPMGNLQAWSALSLGGAPIQYFCKGMGALGRCIFFYWLAFIRGSLCDGNGSLGRMQEENGFLIKALTELICSTNKATYLSWIQYF